MREADAQAALARVIAEPARARMLEALMSGVALTATELAVEADVAPSTASVHLAKLVAAEVLAIEQQGRHRYFRLAGPEIATLLETLAGVAVSGSRRPSRPIAPELRAARVCYDHLAGERGVWLLDTLGSRRLVSPRDGALSAAGEAFFARFGLDLDALARSRRAFSRLCLDWSERRSHLGGALGAAILGRIFALGWARREPGGRVVTFTERGARTLHDLVTSG